MTRNLGWTVGVLLLGACASTPDPQAVPTAPPDAGGWEPVSSGVSSSPAPAQDIEDITLSAPPMSGGTSLDSTGGRTHTLVKGDTLYALARRYYSDASRWRAILEANRDQISDPNQLYVGQVLTIP